MPFTSLILDTTTENGDRIRSYLGVDLGIKSIDFADVAIFNDSMLGEAEEEILDMMAAQIGIATVDQMKAPGANAQLQRDLKNLRNAVVYYVAALFCNGATNAIDVSITDRGQTKDRGGIGDAWVKARDNAYEDAERALRRIRGWNAFLAIPMQSP